MTSLRDLLRRPIVASDTAEQVGTTEGIVVDPESKQVVAVQISGHKGGDFVGWDDIDALGSDAVMVSSVANVHTANGDLESRAADGSASMLGKRVLDDHGDDLGPVDDVEFDEATGSLHHLRVDEVDIASERLLGVGSYAIVVRADED